MLYSTVGQLLVNQGLPEELQDHSRILDKKSVRELLSKLAETNPEKYKDVITHLYAVGSESGQTLGSSFGLNDVQPHDKIKQHIANLKLQVRDIVNRDDITEPERDKLLEDLMSAHAKPVEDSLFDLGVSSRNPFAIQVLSGSRGSKADMRSLMAGDFLMTDHKRRLIPTPLLRSYSQGVDPAEYWAGSYGARRGLLSTKLATADAGFFGKKLIQAAHKIVVTEDDCGTDRGIPTHANDPDNDGAVLAQDYGTFTGGTPVDNRIMKKLGDKMITVRSPLTCQAKRGVCAKCAGVRETGHLPSVGDNIGVPAAQAIGERVSQAALSEKHKGGIAAAGGEKTGFEVIKQLTEIPLTFKHAASLANQDGTVQDIHPAPQGGWNIKIGDKEHYVAQGQKITVKVGDRVEAGDRLSDGIVNPAEIVHHRGLGEGRLQFVSEFRKILKDSGVPVNRRNIEILARGLVNHVRITDTDGSDFGLPDDVVEYNTLERNYRPRYGTMPKRPSMALGKYIETPVAHYSIGTKVTKRVIKQLNDLGIPEIMTHDDPPSFEPEMQHDIEILNKSPDWQERLGGFYLSRGLRDAAQRGLSSEIHSESFLPALARGSGFGKELDTKGIY